MDPFHIFILIVFIGNIIAAIIGKNYNSALDWLCAAMWIAVASTSIEEVKSIDTKLQQEYNITLKDFMKKKE